MSVNAVDNTVTNNVKISTLKIIIAKGSTWVLNHGAIPPRYNYFARISMFFFYETLL